MSFGVADSDKLHRPRWCLGAISLYYIPHLGAIKEEVLSNQAVLLPTRTMTKETSTPELCSSGLSRQKSQICKLTTTRLLCYIPGKMKQNLHFLTKKLLLHIMLEFKATSKFTMLYSFGNYWQNLHFYYFIFL